VLTFTLVHTYTSLANFRLVRGSLPHAGGRIPVCILCHYICSLTPTGRYLPVIEIRTLSSEVSEVGSCFVSLCFFHLNFGVFPVPAV